MNRCLVVTGMHRSGTSFIASFLQAAGVDIGTDLFPADYYNPRGYFEDNEFLELDTSILHACMPPGASGFRDWGWAENGSLDRSSVADFAARAGELVARRSAAAPIWGWKDPRTSLLLDFWDGLLTDARYVFTYRSPWDVMRSVARLGGTFFEGRPDRALGPWRLYNRSLLDFYRRHRERCLLLPIEALSGSPDELLALVKDKLELPLPDGDGGGEILARVAEPALLSRLENQPGLAALLARVFPEDAELWSELEEAADLKAGRPALVAATEASARRAASPVAPLAVVIRCQDEETPLLACLASLLTNHPPCEPILVDDLTTRPYALELLARLQASGMTLVRPSRSGVSATRNAGIAAARADVVVTLDRAVAPSPDFLTEAAGRFAQQPRLGALRGDPADLPAAQGAPLPDLAALIAGGRGTAPLLRRSAWREVEGYDEGLDGGYQDWDILLALAERGWVLAQAHASICAGSSTSRPDSEPLSLAQQRLFLERVAARHPLLVDPRLPGLLAQLEQQLLVRAETDLQESARETQRLQGEAHELRAELDRWRERVAFMEATRSWRLRDKLIALRHRFGRRAPQ